MASACSKDSDLPGRPPSLIHLRWWQRTQGFFIRTAKTDQTGRMPRLIRVFAGRTGHFVGFVMLSLKCFYVVALARVAVLRLIFDLFMAEPLILKQAQLLITNFSYLNPIFCL